MNPFCSANPIENSKHSDIHVYTVSCNNDNTLRYKKKNIYIFIQRKKHFKDVSFNRVLIFSYEYD